MPLSVMSFRVMPLSSEFFRAPRQVNKAELFDLIQSSKERRQERLAFWNRRNSGEIHCQIVLRIGFQQTRSG